MQFCPNCKTEYTDEAEICADCQIPLVDQLPDDVNAGLEECENCNGKYEFDSDYCPHCGTLFAEDQYSCTNHPTGVAAGVCVICHQLFCEKCLTKKNGRYLCSDHAAVEVSEGWALVFKSSDYIEAEIIHGKLESAGITTNRRNTGNIATLADGFIDNALGRTIFKYPIKIFVPSNHYLEAIKIVNENFSESETTE
ncbi:MAG: zinc ribbon domain-containing protein [Bacteroidota bacterium]|nr:zinc ribbon domain-containing protein [Bacteroidota bacterium]